MPDDRKDEFGVGDVRCWVAIDADSKLVPSWLMGNVRPPIASRSSTTCATGCATASSSPRTLTRATRVPWGSCSQATWIGRRWSRNTSPRASRRAARPPACTGMHVESRRLGHYNIAKTSTSYIKRQNLRCGCTCAGSHGLTNTLYKEAGEPRGGRGAALHGLQLRSSASSAREPVPADPGDGGRGRGSHLDYARDRRTVRLAHSAGCTAGPSLCGYTPT